MIHDSMEKLETMTSEEASRSFLELDQERTDIRSIEEYVLVMPQLVDIKNVLGDAPAGTRVRTAIRDLQECLPQIRQMDDQRLKCRTSARIVELERAPPRCPDGHSMVVRQGMRLEDKVNLLAVGPDIHATRSLAIDFDLALPFTVISMSRPSTSRSRIRRSIEKPDSLPCLSAETLG